MKETKETNKQINPLIITVVVALVVGVASFVGGMKVQERRGFSFAGRQFNGQFQGRGQGGQLPGGRGISGRPVVGEIISMDDKSITIKMQDGSTKIALLSDSTTYSKSENGSKTDLLEGVQVGVFGMENSDGSVTAQNIQLNPQFRMTVMQPSQTAK